MKKFFSRAAFFAASVFALTFPAQFANAKIFPLPVPGTTGQLKISMVKTRLHIPAAAKKPSPYVTFGQYFKKGDWKKGANLIVFDANGRALPTASAIKKTYSNGDIRHAIITVKLAAVSPGASYEVSLRTDGSAPRSPLKLNVAQLPDVKVRVLNRKGGVDKTISLRELTQKQTGSAWFESALAVEKRFSAAAIPGLVIDYDVRAYENGEQRIDVTFRYDRLKTTPMRPAYYSAEIYANGKLIRNFADLEHPHHTAFREKLTFGYDGENYASLNPYYLQEAGAIPAYDFSQETPAYEIRAVDGAMNDSANAAQIARYGLLNPYMPSTGGRPELGILPKWTVQYIISDDPRTRNAMMKHAEIAGRIPWRFFDEKTGEPPLPKDHPNLWIDSRATPEKHGIAPFNPEDKTQAGASKWVPDTAHQPSLSYFPYLITGDRFFYDNLKTQYFFNKFSIDPGLIEDRTWRTQYVEQVRAYGWIQRTAAQFLNVIPDQDPANEYARTQFIKDFNFLQEMFINGKYYDKGASAHVLGELKGYLDGWGSDDGRQNPNFMQDLAAMSIAWAADAGYSPAMQFSAAQVNFIAGRFLQKYNGYDPKYATVYKFNQFIPDDPKGVDTPLGKKKVYSTWKEAFDYSVRSGYFAEPRKEIEKNGLPGWPESPDGYVAYARASNAAIFNVTRDPRAIEAYGFTVPYLERASEKYKENPTFLIQPKFKNGEILRDDLIKIGGGFSNRLTAQHNGLLYGGSGDDELYGGGGEAFIFGGEDNDVLKSGAQGGMLFGDEGSDSLISGGGPDYLQGDPRKYSQKDSFIFTRADFGNDVIADFKPGKDKIVFRNVPQLQTYEEINTLYGISSEKDGDQRASIFYQEANPDLEYLLPEKYKKTFYQLLQKTSAGDKDAKKELKGNLEDLLTEERKKEADKLLQKVSSLNDVEARKTLKRNLEHLLMEERKKHFGKLLQKASTGDAEAKQELKGNLADLLTEERKKDFDKLLQKASAGNTDALQELKRSVKYLLTEERKRHFDKLLQKTSKGDTEARKQLNLSDSPNRGVMNYVRVSPYGDVLIDLNYKLTDTEKESLGGKRYGIVRLVGVKKESLSPSDFVFE